MTNSNLSALTLAELKDIAHQLGCYLQGTQSGDKRRKQSWIDAIEAAQAIETLVEPEDDFEAVVMSIDCERIAETTAKLFFDTFNKSVDEPWDSTDICGESAPVDDEPWDSTDICGESEPVETIPSTKKGSVSVAASIVCLLIFALTALCQILSVSIKYGYLLIMLTDRWNHDLMAHKQLYLNPDGLKWAS